MCVFRCIFTYMSIATVEEKFMNLRRRPGRNWSERIRNDINMVLMYEILICIYKIFI